jgi:hypothetical protein
VMNGAMPRGHGEAPYHNTLTELPGLINLKTRPVKGPAASRKKPRRKKSCHYVMSVHIVFMLRQLEEQLQFNMKPYEIYK